MFVLTHTLICWFVCSSLKHMDTHTLLTQQAKWKSMAHLKLGRKSVCFQRMVCRHGNSNDARWQCGEFLGLEEERRELNNDCGKLLRGAFTIYLFTCTVSAVKPEMLNYD